jgi:hypothetical protein
VYGAGSKMLEILSISSAKRIGTSSSQLLALDAGIPGLATALGAPELGVPGRALTKSLTGVGLRGSLTAKQRMARVRATKKGGSFRLHWQKKLVPLCAQIIIITSKYGRFDWLPWYAFSTSSMLMVETTCSYSSRVI